jgi:hypothetical protein
MTAADFERELRGACRQGYAQLRVQLCATGRGNGLGQLYGHDC